MTPRQRAIDIAQTWLKREDINPKGELTLVAQTFIDEVSRRDDVVSGVVELPPWPFDRKAPDHE